MVILNQKVIGMATKVYWLSYDLGVGGDYDGLYAWLDDHNAKPCGQSVAFFKYSTNRRDIDRALEEELIESVKLRPGNRLYIVRDKEADKGSTIAGTFIYGKRNAAPWEGFGKQSPAQEDE